MPVTIGREPSLLLEQSSCPYEGVARSVDSSGVVKQGLQLHKAFAARDLGAVEYITAPKPIPFPAVFW